MPAWQWTLDVLAVVLLLVLAYGLLLLVRRRVLARDGGTFELSVRVRSSSEAGRGWVLGLGRYRGEELQWFRIFSPSPRPRRAWLRDDLEVVEQRAPAGEEVFALYAGDLVVECRARAEKLSLAMSRSALTGFSSWLEAGPPGADWERGPRAR